MSPFNLSPPLTGHSPSSAANLVHHMSTNLWSDPHHSAVSVHNNTNNNVNHHGLLTTSSHHSIHGVEHGYTLYSSGKQLLVCFCLGALLGIRKYYCRVIGVGR